MSAPPEERTRAAGASRPALTWRDARLDDAEAISGIEHQVHTLAHERVAVFREKIALFGAGSRVAMLGGQVVGYGIAYPYRTDDVPPLDRFLGEIPPDATCLFLHDVAILPEARASGGSAAFVDHATRVAARRGLRCLALVSVYGTDTLWRRYGFVASPSAATAAQLRPYGGSAIYMVRQSS